MKFALALFIALTGASLAVTADRETLILERTISLDSPIGRIDHLAVDIRRERLFVAQLGDNSVAVVDLRTATVLAPLNRMDEPQGVLFVAATDELYVSNGGDGSIRVFAGDNLAPKATIKLGGDADNLRLDPKGRYVVAGYGNGALAMIDISSHRLQGTIPVGGHPEAFQLSQDGRHAFVNVPGKHEVATADMETRRSTGSWSTPAGGNFPMALEPSESGLWSAFRSPPRLVRFDTASGAVTQTLESCEDSDDVFIDNLRRRLYQICGSGHLDVWEQRSAQYVRIAHISTAPGARSGLYVPELDRLYVALRSNIGKPAAILVFRPSPD